MNPYQSSELNDNLVQLIIELRARWLRENREYSFYLPEEPQPFLPYTRFMQAYKRYRNGDSLSTVESVKSSSSQQRLNACWNSLFSVFDINSKLVPSNASGNPVQKLNQEVQKMMVDAGLTGKVLRPTGFGFQLS